MRKGLLMGVALGAMVQAVPAIAQEQGAEEASAGGIDAIIVTARRQAESSQDAALAIDAIGADALVEQGITDALDLTKAAPSISFANGGGALTSIFLRGVGTVTTNAYADAAITASYDGVVLSRQDGVVGAAFYDLERVEVLKGPQGILYGRNATGGTVNIIPARPELGYTGGGVNFGYGNYNDVSLDGFVNLEVSDNSALRVSGMHQSHDGYNRDGTDDLSRSGFRAQFLIEPTDTVSVRIAGDWTGLTGKGAGAGYVGRFQGQTYIPAPAAIADGFEGMGTDAANAYRGTVLGAPGFGFLNPLGREQELDFTFWGVNAEVNIETGLGDLTFIPAYRENDGYSYFNGPAFNPAFSGGSASQFSSELRLAGSSGPIDYIVGGFYLKEEYDNIGQYNQEFVLPTLNYHGETESWAAFGQLTANITDQFRLVGGLRYTRDNKLIAGGINNLITFCGGIPLTTPPASFGVVGTAGVGCQAPGNLPHYPDFNTIEEGLDWLIAEGWIDPGSTIDQPNPVYPLLTGAGVVLRDVSVANGSGGFDRLTWKVSAEYDVTPDNLLYATVETGYRAGGFQASSAVIDYDPEFITAYTIGSKNQFAGNTIQLNLEAFWWKYRDQQINFFTVSDTGVLSNVIDNVGRSQIRGFDVDAIFKPSWATTLSAKVQFLDTEYDDLLLRTAPPRDNFNCPRSNTGETTTDGSPIIEFDCSGNPLLYAPKWTVNLSAEHIVPLSENLELVGTVYTAWRDEQWGGFNYQPFQLIPANWNSGANLTLRNAEDDWYISAYVTNIEGGRNFSFPQVAPVGFATTTYTAPRTYGVRLGATF